MFAVRDVSARLESGSSAISAGKEAVADIPGAVSSSLAVVPKDGPGLEASALL